MLFYELYCKQYLNSIFPYDICASQNINVVFIQYTCMYVTNYLCSELLKVVRKGVISTLKTVIE